LIFRAAARPGVLGAGAHGQAWSCQRRRRPRWVWCGGRIVGIGRYRRPAKPGTRLRPAGRPGPAPVCGPPDGGPATRLRAADRGRYGVFLLVAAACVSWAVNPDEAARERDRGRAAERP
jgi:hypothetical protein